MKRLHKILLVVLTVAMLLGVIVVSAFAGEAAEVKIGDKTYATLQEAVADVNDAESGLGNDVTITLVKDVVLPKNGALTVTRPGVSLTLDLAGYSINTSSVVNNKQISEEESVKLAVFYLGTADTALTVKGGSIISGSTFAGLFYIEDGVNAKLTLDGVTAGFKGAEDASLINARGGEVTVNNCALSASGINTAIIRQAGGARVAVSNSTLASTDGSGALSAVLRVDPVITPVVEENPETEDVPAPASDTSALEESTVRTPDVTFEGVTITAANAVIIGYVNDSDDTVTVDANTYVSFSSCDIMQKNYDKYNDDANLLNESRNAISKGMFVDLAFDGCDVKYAFAGIDTVLGQTVTVKNSVFSMTFDGQRYYLLVDAENPTKSEKVEVEGYLISGLGTVTVESSEFYFPRSGVAHENYVTDNSVVVDPFVNVTDDSGATNLKLGEGVFLNISETDWVNPFLADEKLQAVKVGTLSYGLYVTEGEITGKFAGIQFVHDLEYLPYIHMTTLRTPIESMSTVFVNANGVYQGTSGGSHQPRIAFKGGPTFTMEAAQGRVTIETDGSGNKYYCYDPSYVYNPYGPDGTTANVDTNGDGIKDAWDLDGDYDAEAGNADEACEYFDTNGDGVADIANITKNSSNKREKFKIPESYSRVGNSLSGYMAYEKTAVSDISYYTVDLDLKTGDGAGGFIPFTSFYVHTRGSGNISANGGTITLTQDGMFGSENIKSQMKLNGWNHITVVVKVDQTNPNDSVFYYYLEGKYVGSAKNAESSKDTVIGFYGIRYGCGSNFNYKEGAKICVDNVVTKAYPKTYTSTEVTELLGDTTKTLDVWSDAWYNSEHRVIPSDDAAMIGNVGYESFEKAYAAAEDGDTISLIKDVKGVVTIEKSITVNTNGRSFVHKSETHTAAKSGSSVIFKEAKSYEIANIIFNNRGTVVGVTVAQGNYAEYTGEKIVEGPHFESESYVEFLGWNTHADGSGEMAPALVYVAADTTVITYHAVYDVQGAGAAFAIVDTKTGDVESWGYTTDDLYYSMKNAIDKTLVLLKDFVLEDTKAFEHTNENVKIDTNGHKISYVNGESGASFAVVNDETGFESWGYTDEDLYTAMKNAAGKTIVLFKSFHLDGKRAVESKLDNVKFDYNGYTVTRGEITGVTFAVIPQDASKDVTFGTTADEFVAAMESATFATIVLYDDIELTATSQETSKSVAKGAATAAIMIEQYDNILAIDLNGHTIKVNGGSFVYAYRYIDAYLVNNETKEEQRVKGRKDISEYADDVSTPDDLKAKYSFKNNTPKNGSATTYTPTNVDNGLNLFIYSSVPGGTLDTGSNPAFVQSSDGVCEIQVGGKTVSGYSSGVGHNHVSIGRNINAEKTGESVTVKCGQFASLAAYVSKIFLDDANVISSVATVMNYTTGYVVANNTVFTSTKGGAAMFSFANIKRVYFTGCTFIGPELAEGTTTYPTLFTNASPSDDALTLTDCNVYNYLLAATAIANKKVTMRDTAYNVAYGADTEIPLAENYVSVETAQTARVITANGTTYVFPYMIAPENATVTVTWVGADGNTIMTETYVKGTAAVYHGTTAVDLEAYEWVAEGGKSMTALTEDVTITLTLKPDDNAPTAPTVGYNVTITDKFTLNIYVGNVEGITVNSITLNTPNGENVMVETAAGSGIYTAESTAVGPQFIDREVVFYITYTNSKDETVTESVALSILGYAKDVLADDTSEAVVKELVFDMVNYANEAHKLFVGSTNANINEVVEEYKATYGASDVVDASGAVGELATVITNAKLVLKSEVTYVFTVADGYSGTVVIDGTTYTVSGGDTISHKVNVEDLTTALNITAGSVSGSYSLANYVNALDAQDSSYAIANALWSFAKAADALED